MKTLKYFITVCFKYLDTILNNVNDNHENVKKTYHFEEKIFLWFFQVNLVKDTIKKIYAKY